VAKCALVIGPVAVWVSMGTAWVFYGELAVGNLFLSECFRTVALSSRALAGKQQRAFPLSPYHGLVPCLGGLQNVILIQKRSFGVRLGVVRGPFGDRSGTVRGSFGDRPSAFFKTLLKRTKAYYFLLLLITFPFCSLGFFFQCRPPPGVNKMTFNKAS